MRGGKKRKKKHSYRCSEFKTNVQLLNFRWFNYSTLEFEGRCIYFFGQLFSECWRWVGVGGLSPEMFSGIELWDPLPSPRAAGSCQAVVWGGGAGVPFSWPVFIDM